MGILKYIKYIYWYTNSSIKANRNLSIQLYILNIFKKKYERFQILCKNFHRISSKSVKKKQYCAVITMN